MPATSLYRDWLASTYRYVRKLFILTETLSHRCNKGRETLIDAF